MSSVLAKRSDALPESRWAASRWCLSIILGVAAILRVASIFVIRSYQHPVTWEFGELADAIFSGYGCTKLLQKGVRVPSAHMPPLYPYLLAYAWKMFGKAPRTYLGIEMVQALLGVLLVFFVYRLACVLTQRRTALTAAGIVAVWPSFVYLCNEFHSISIYILAGTAAVYYVARFMERPRSWMDTVLLGLCLGVLLLCRAEAVVLVPCYGLMLGWRCASGSRLKGVMACVVAGACLLPWTMRNARVFGHPVLVSTSGGFNLWVGHNAFAIGNSDYGVDFLHPDERAVLDRLSGRDAELAASRAYSSFAWRYVRRHPLGELRLAAKKLFFFVLFDPSHKKGRQIGYWLPSLVLTFLGGWGLWLRRRNLLGSDFPLILNIVFSALLAVVVFSLPRYRIAIDPFVAIFAAHALVSLSDVDPTRSDIIVRHVKPV